MKNKIYIAIICAFSIVFAVSSGFLIKHYCDSAKQAEMYDNLIEVVETEPEETTELMNYSEEKTFIPEYQELYLQNNDMVGWIKVEDTKINYPVMQSKDNPNFYLKHGFDKAYTDYGCPYVQENCDMELPSDNIIIYGHHMNDGSMFAGLMKFKDKSFWEKHKTVSFDTLTDRQTYEVIAVFKTVVYTDTVHDVTLEYPGQIIKLSAYDKPASLGVTITKRGNAQVMAGQSMRYDLTVANTSNVPLESFFWHDKIPYDVARPTTLTTGTYSARLNYRILYKTNCNTSYQVLASNLLTSNNYSFSLNAIPMQAGEVVTDIYFDFGKVPVGFQSVVNPTLSVMVNGNAVNGYQMVNRADVGGKYQGTWQTATASWVTIIRRLWNTPTLPKTGY